MIEPASAQDLFKGRPFDQEIIILCVRWYLSFKLSSRDLVQMMAARGIALAHTTILRWVQRYVPEFDPSSTVIEPCVLRKPLLERLSGP
jgi:transposase-like protein